MPRHVRVGYRRYSGLQGVDLSQLRTWRGRVVSVEALITDLTNSLRKHGFRPFRPLEIVPSANDSVVESRITGLRDVKVGLRFPWQPARVSCALAIDIKGRKILAKTLQGISPIHHQATYDVSASFSGGGATFRRQWKALHRAKFDRLARDVIDKIMMDLNETSMANTDGAWTATEPPKGGPR